MFNGFNLSFKVQCLLGVPYVLRCSCLIVSATSQMHVGKSSVEDRNTYHRHRPPVAKTIQTNSLLSQTVLKYFVQYVTKNFTAQNPVFPERRQGDVGAHGTPRRVGARQTSETGPPPARSSKTSGPIIWRLLRALRGGVASPQTSSRRPKVMA